MARKSRPDSRKKRIGFGEDSGSRARSRHPYQPLSKEPLRAPKQVAEPKIACVIPVAHFLHQFAMVRFFFDMRIPRKIFGALPTLLFLAALMLGWFIAVAPAQGQDQSRSGEVPIAQFIPGSAGVYLHVRHLGEVNEALHRANVWRILPLMFSGGGSGVLPDDLQDAVAQLLGSATIRPHELVHTEVGLAASSLDGLSQAVLYVRIPDESVVDRWFPERRRTASAVFGETRSFRMEDGTVVSVRDGILAIGRRSEGDRVLLDATYLMRGRSVKRLDETAAFAQARTFLPTRPLATIYVSPGGSSEGASGAEEGNGEERPHLLAALYEADGGLDIAVRGTIDAPVASGRLSIDTVERFLKLPRSTLFAAARTVDAGSWLSESSGPDQGGSVLSRYVRSLIGLVDVDGSVLSSLPRVGPDVMIAWDQNLDERGIAPQLALLFQSADASRFQGLITRIVRRLFDLIARLDSADAVASLELAEDRHLGSPYVCLSLRTYSEVSLLPFGKLLGSVEPCWATDGGWVIITLGRDHLMRILDAQRGMAPSLSSIREMSVLRRRQADLNAVAMIHGELVAGVLDDWLRHAVHGTGPSLLAPGWLDDLSNPGGASRRNVGIGMRSRQEPGVVVVAAVHAGTAADGLIEVGDRVVGIDGAVLALEQANADLRRRLHESRGHPGPTLRVQRGERMLDVVLPLRDTSGTLPQLGVSPIEAVRELASLVRTIPFASFALTSLDDSHFAARVTVRFASKSAERIPPE